MSSIRKIILSLYLLIQSNYLNASNPDTSGWDITHWVDDHYKTTVSRENYGKIFIYFERDPSVDLTNYSAVLRFGETTIRSLSDFGQNIQKSESFIYCWTNPYYRNKTISVDIMNEQNQFVALGYYDPPVQRDIYNIHVQITYEPGGIRCEQSLNIQVGANKLPDDPYSFLCETLRADPKENKNSIFRWVTKTTRVDYEDMSLNRQLLLKSQKEIKAFNRNIENANQEDSPIRWEKKSSPEVIYVPQRYLKDTHSTSPNPVIGTYGAWPCFIIAAYNRSTLKAAVCHMDILYLEAVRYMLLSMQEVKDSQIEIHLAGGDGACLERLEETKQLIDFIKKFDNVKIKSSSISDPDAQELSPRKRAASLAIGSRNGEVYKEVDVDDFIELDNSGISLESDFSKLLF